MVINNYTPAQAKPSIINTVGKCHIDCSTQRHYVHSSGSKHSNNILQVQLEHSLCYSSNWSSDKRHSCATNYLAYEQEIRSKQNDPASRQATNKFMPSTVQPLQLNVNIHRMTNWCFNSNKHCHSHATNKPCYTCADLTIALTAWSAAATNQSSNASSSKGPSVPALSVATADESIVCLVSGKPTITSASVVMVPPSQAQSSGCAAASPVFVLVAATAMSDVTTFSTTLEPLHAPAHLEPSCCGLEGNMLTQALSSLETTSIQGPHRHSRLGCGYDSSLVCYALPRPFRHLLQHSTRNPSPQLVQHSTRNPSPQLVLSSKILFTHFQSKWCPNLISPVCNQSSLGHHNVFPFWWMNDDLGLVSTFTIHPFPPGPSLLPVR